MIGLVLALLIIGIMIVIYMRSNKAPSQLSGPMIRAETRIAADLKTFGILAQDNKSTFQNVTAGRYELYLPDVNYELVDGDFIRTSNSGNETVVDRIVSAFFVYYDGEGYEQPAPLDEVALENWRQLEIVLRQHTKEESLDMAANDGVEGIDLDGDPSNGTAPIKEYVLTFSLR